MSQGKAIGNAVYLILGLAILAMCFDLMREEVALTMRKMYDSITSWTSDGQVKSPTARPVAGTRREVEMEVRRGGGRVGRGREGGRWREGGRGRDGGRGGELMDLGRTGQVIHSTA